MTLAREMPKNFDLTEQQKRFIHKYIEGQQQSPAQISVTDWERIAEKVRKEKSS